MHARVTYDTLARGYDRAHARWLRHAGGSAQAALDGALAALVRPGMRILDAGCGTGAVARRIVTSLCADVELTLVDVSVEMLARTLDIPSRRLLGSLDRTRLGDGSFDLILCCWALEAGGEPRAFLASLMRMLAPGGTLLLVFCAEKPAGGPAARLMKSRILANGAGAFLDPGDVRRSIEGTGEAVVREVPCAGPATTFIVTRPIPKPLAA